MRPEITLLNKVHVAQIEASLERIRLGIIYFNLAIFVAGGLASYLLALRTLRPIEEALEAQSRFTADASHELRTPMTVIRSELEVALRDRTLTIKDSRALHVSTLEEITKLEQLTNNLLTLARQDALPLLDTQKYQLDGILSEAVARIRPKAAEKRVGLSQDDCGLSVMTERSSLLELLVILLDNAVKYSPSGQNVSVMAKLRHRGQNVAITVRDQGIGIAPDDIAHIFQRFWRSDRSRARADAGGYGLGLPIAETIVKRLGGQLEVSSSLHNGSDFTIILPISRIK